MGLLSQRGTWTGPFSLKDPKLNDLFDIGARSLAGPVVTELTAYTAAAFWDGVWQQASDIAKTPLNLHKRRKDGGSDHFTDSKTYKLMKYRPNPEMRSMVFRRTLTAWALVYGNGYAEIVRDVLGRPAAIWPLHPLRVTPFFDEETRAADDRQKPLRYRIDGETVLSPRDVLHLQGPSDDGYIGLNLVKIAREALGLALASQQFASAFFGNGTRFGGVLSSEQDLDEPQKDEIRKEIEKLHARADKAFRLLVLGAGFKFHESGSKPSEAQMKEIRDQQVAEVARFLNMPLYKLKLNQPGAVSYASVEMADLDYYKGPIHTWMRLWEEELEGKLIPDIEIGHQFFRHNANAFLRGDIKSRYDALGIALDKGVINADEWRDLEDMNPQPDGQGKLYLVQGAMVPKNKIQDIAQANIDKAKQPPPAPAPAPGGSNANRDELEAAIARAAAAEALAAEARAQYQTEHDARVAAEARAETTAGELEERRRSESEALAKLSTFEILAADRKRDAELAEAARQAAATEAETSRAAVERSREEAEQARQAVTEATTERDRLVAEAQTRADQAEQAARDAAAARQASEAAASEAKAHLSVAVARQVELDGERQRLEAETTERAAEIERLRAQVAEAEEIVQEEVANASRAALAQATAETARGDAETLAIEAAARAEAAVAERVRIQAELDAATGDASALRERVEAADQAVEAARADLAAAVALRDEAEGQRVQFEQRVAEAEARAAAAEEARAAAESALTVATGGNEEIAQQLADLTRQLAESAERVQALEAEHRAAAARHDASVSEAQALAEAERQAREAAEARATAAESERQAALARVTESRTATIARLSGVIAAHRALVVDVVTRLVEREVDRARSRQQSPEKIRAWMATFYGPFEESFVEAILPAVRVHLAWKQAGEDPAQMARDMAARYCEESQAQLRAFVSAPADEFHVAVDHLLKRWERDRPAAMADALLQDEVTHLREMERGDA